MKQVIYETKGRAREFNELAINLFTGCGHKCIYCYGADVTHQDRDSYENRPRPRVTEKDVIASARQWVAKGETRKVLLCFVTDPYQAIEQETQLTRKSIMALHDAGLNVHILTKAGLRSMRDFDLLTKDDAYATTLTLTDESDSRIWEPNAAPPTERIEALKEAHRLEIETWVSFEPIIYPKQTYSLFHTTRGFVGHYKVGTFNYANKLPANLRPQVQNISWWNFGWEMKRIMDDHNTRYYFKKDLLREMGVSPSNFKQTWVCR